jgi:two-component system sensor histidine kinase BaeS
MQDPPLKQLRLLPNRWLVIGLSAAAPLAVLVMLTIFRRVLAPVEALTEGARALASGRLDARVPVRGETKLRVRARVHPMAEALERNERSRRNMVSDVAHELRTPLTNIRVHIEAARTASFPSTRNSCRRSMKKRRRSRAWSTICSSCRQEAGVLRLEIAEVRMTEVIERAVEIVGPAPASVIRNVPSDSPFARCARMVRLCATREQRDRACENRVEGECGACDAVEIRVADDGPGVPPEHVERIFDRSIAPTRRARARPAARASASRSRSNSSSRTAAGSGMRRAFVIALGWDE